MIPVTISTLFSNLDVTGVLVLCLLSILPYVLLASKGGQFPLINGPDKLELFNTRSKQKFLKNARDLIKSGLEAASIFRIISENGEKIVLAPKYAAEIRSHPALSFGASIAKDFHSNLRGFEPFQQGSRSDEIFQTAIRTKLTQSLGSVTKPLSEEMSIALEKEWSNSNEWHSLTLKPSILKIVAQLSSRVFLGDKICRNQDWLRITVSYTVDSFAAAVALRQWPEFTRPLAALLLPSCQKVRRELDEARSIIEPVLEERQRAKTEASRSGKPVEKFNDAMQWMEDVAKGRSYDPAVAQMSFSLAAIHTTSDMLTQVLFDICGKEDIIQDLRREITTVVQEEGWKKTTLYKLKFMDSVLKESQRLKPIGIASMRRIAMKDIQLSDGNKLPKGTSLFVSGERMWDHSVYPDPDVFDPYRFLKLRETPGQETSAQLVSPSPEHMGFGYGNHACPGRFFAANELKIALAHILLKYDFQLVPGAAKPSIRRIGVSWNSDATAKVAIRRRQVETSFLVSE